ncbi:14219_t:CDS:2 [Entrophospora sp. SA101]|nr:14219_t:CDS:2 [Entrophospora sp. SA101]
MPINQKLVRLRFFIKISDGSQFRFANANSSIEDEQKMINETDSYLLYNLLKQEYCGIDDSLTNNEILVSKLVKRECKSDSE